MKSKVWAKIMLFSATVIWGFSFVVMKDSVSVIPPNYLLAGRFLLAFALLSVVFANRLKNIDRSYLVGGGIVGAALFASYCAQTFGLTGTTPGKNAFLTATYVVMVPFLVWAVKRKRPDMYSFAAAFICIVGIGFVALHGNFTMSYGDALTLLCGFLFAVHLMCISRFGEDKDPILLSIIQFGTAGILAFITALIFEKPPHELSTGSISSIIFLAVFPTALGLTFQIVGQKYTEPMSASLILSLEAVFGIVFSLAVGMDTMNAKLGIGFALIFAALIISETKLSFLRKKQL
ncbi:MAG: DMT family transporter [Clostridia bacterium]|nr:DMT family transporter [Clostridia bacterium]